MIKKRNLDNSLIQWIMTQTGLGPGIGEIQYMCRPDSSTSRFATQLADNNIADGNVHATLLLAEAATKAYRNDIILVMPGNYLETATLDWDKDYVHMLGLGGENVYSDWTLYGTTIYTTGNGVDYVIDMSGERNSIRNICLNNYGANAACLSAARVNGYGNSFYNTHFTALMLSQQIGEPDASCLDIGKGAHYALFKRCIIGQNEWGTRTNTGQGTLVFSGTSAPPPANGHFIDCIFRMRSDTLLVPMVYTMTANSIGRDWLFENSVFTNFSTNYTYKLDRVFQHKVVCSTVFIGLRNCSAYGFTEWQNSDSAEWVVSDMPIVGRGGGLALLANAPSGT